MAIVVTDKCTDCRYTECVTVCPVSCFHGDDRMLYIDPTECIECQACVPVYPTQAIFHDADLSEESTKWIAVNAERSKHLPIVDLKQTPLARET